MSECITSLIKWILSRNNLLNSRYNMNKIYSLKYSSLTGGLIAVSEL
ncbi:hypothetical protein C9287_25000, partial (plasmid) [Escherichia coli]